MQLSGGDSVELHLEQLTPSVCVGCNDANDAATKPPKLLPHTKHFSPMTSSTKALTCSRDLHTPKSFFLSFLHCQHSAACDITSE